MSDIKMKAEKLKKYIENICGSNFAGLSDKDYERIVREAEDLGKDIEETIKMFQTGNGK